MSEPLKPWPKSTQKKPRGWPHSHMRRNTCGYCHRTWIGVNDFCVCGGTAWVVEWVYEWSWCLDCGASGTACLIQEPCELCGGIVSAVQPGERAARRRYVKQSATAMGVMPPPRPLGSSPEPEQCPTCGRSY